MLAVMKNSNYPLRHLSQNSIFDDFISGFKLDPWLNIDNSDNVRRDYFTRSVVDGKLKYEIDLPGVGDSDLDVTLSESGVLTITGKRVNRKFKYSITPEKEYDVETTTGKLKNGVLTLIVEPKARSDPRKVKISIE